MLDLGPRARVVFALLFLAAELALLVTAPLRVDKVFGFQMFNASSDIRIELYRRIRRRGKLVEVHVRDGTWIAPDAGGTPHQFSWGHLLRGTRLTRLDVRRHAKDGVGAQVYHLQRALDYAIERIPDDAQTVALVARVQGVHNGHTRVELVLESRAR